MPSWRNQGSDKQHHDVLGLRHRLYLATTSERGYMGAEGRVLRPGASCRSAKEVQAARQYSRNTRRATRVRS
eukprot:773835-Pyramimonas_sp.AAC.1